MTRNGSRRRGTNPRRKLTNPRAMGTNKSAGTPRDATRVYNLRDVALAVLHRAGRHHCDTCADTGAHANGLCDCRPITSREAAAIVNTTALPPSAASVRDAARARKEAWTQRHRR